MDQLFKTLPDIIKAAAQSQLGILALLVVALAILAYIFFAKARVKIRVGIFVLLFAGVVGFGIAMFHASDNSNAPQGSATPKVAALSKEARSLLAAAAADSSGYVLYEKFGASVDLHANGKSFLTDKGDHRAVALWESALQELTDRGLLAGHGESGGEVYEITQKGYDAAAAAGAAASEPRT